jgi:hypothetical protein
MDVDRKGIVSARFYFEHIVLAACIARLDVMDIATGHEQAPQIAAIGAGLQLSANGIQTIYIRRVEKVAATCRTSSSTRSTM